MAKLSGILSEPAPGPADPARRAGQAGPDQTAGGARIAHMRPFYDIALAGFGPERLMFGSDWPVSTLTARYADVHAAARALTADLSPAEKAAVFRDTAQRTCRLRLSR